MRTSLVIAVVAYASASVVLSVEPSLDSIVPESNQDVFSVVQLPEEDDYGSSHGPEFMPEGYGSGDGPHTDLPNIDYKQAEVPSWAKDLVDMPGEINHALEGEVHEPEDSTHKLLNRKNLAGEWWNIGDGRTSITDANGKSVPKSNIGYTTRDAYTSKTGHYYLGPSRRRIGSGFGRRRRGVGPDPIRVRAEKQARLKLEAERKKAEAASEQKAEAADYATAKFDVAILNHAKATKAKHDALTVAHYAHMDAQQAAADLVASKPSPMEIRREDCLKSPDGMFTTVKGNTVNVEDASGVEGMAVVWTQFKTDKKYTAKTNHKGLYEIKLPRCEYFTFRLYKAGFHEDGGVGACEDPLLVREAVEFWTSGVSPTLPKNQVRVLLTWRHVKAPNDKHNVDYTKDLDLHMAIPGGVQVLLPQYRHLTRKKADTTAKMLVSGKASLDSLKETAIFKASDLGPEPDQDEVLESEHGHHSHGHLHNNGAMDEFDGHHWIFWDNTGDRNTFPFVEYELDHGSADGESSGGGPEAIHIFKLLKKQYLIYVDCFTCDEFEDDWGDDQPRKLTLNGLKQFQQSEALVRVVQGNEQTYCKSISSAPGHPHTRWDAAVLSCSENQDSKCVVHDINQFNKASPTAHKMVMPTIPLEAKAEVIIAGTPGTRAGDTNVPDAADAQEVDPGLEDAGQMGWGKS